MATFDNIFHLATHYDETELFHFYGNCHLPNSYSLNVMNLDFSANAEALTILEDYFLDYAYELNLHYYSFQLPLNQTLDSELLSFIDEKGYGLEVNRLMHINPQFFKNTKSAPADVVVEFIGTQSLAQYKSFNHQEDLAYGQNFADEKQLYYELCFCEPNIYQIGALKNGKIIGAMTAIETKDYIEIDNFSVSADLQCLGIGSSMQQFIMNFAVQKNKSVILVADADDTPLEMYLKQGYQDFGFRVGIHREIEDTIRAEIAADRLETLTFN